MIWSMLIFVLSLATLMMFFVSYCRSLMASSSRHALSREVRDVTGITALPTARDFDRVRQLLQLCPECPDDRPGLQAVSLYYDILNFVQRTIVRMVPSIQGWTDHELAGCASFAVVVLDKRIAFSREILARQDEI